MKKPATVVLTMLCSFCLLTGCGYAAMPDLTMEESSQIAEYAAGVVLKYSKNYDDGLATKKEIQQEEAKQERAKQYKKEKEEKKKQETAAKDNASQSDASVSGNSTAAQGVVYEDLAQVLSLEETTIVYNSFEVCDSYPAQDSEDFYFAMDATEGMKLLVLKFTLTNQSASDQEIDILTKNAIFEIGINGGNNAKALTTLLLDDLSTFKGMVKAEEAMGLVLVTQVDSAEAEGVQTLALSVTSEGNRASIALQ